MKSLRIAFVGGIIATLGLACAAEPVDPPDGQGGSTVVTGVGGTGATGGEGGTAGEGGDGDLCEQDCSAIAPPVCHVAVCNEGSYPGPVGQCVVVSADNGTACEDGEFCTTGDACEEGICVGGPQNDCGMAAGQCEAVVCDETAKSCDIAPADDGLDCTPADLCLIGATCQGGACGGGEPKDCFFSPVPNECHVAVCNPNNGMCEPVPGNDGASCTDTNDLCTVGKTCAGGQCGGGTPKDCSVLTQGCNLGVCDPLDGQCTTMAVPNGQLCDDLDACTTGEICTAGTCGGGGPVTTCSLNGDGCCPASCTAATDYDCNCFAGALTTSFTNTSGWDGIMFDVTAVATLEVQSFEANIDPGSKTIQVYYKSGTHVGFESNPNAWTLAGSAVVNPSQAGVGTPIPVAVNLTIPAGQSYAFYIVSTAGGTLSNGINYVLDVTTGTLQTQDANLKIYGGKGRGSNFAGSTFSNRGFSGTILYEKCAQ